MIDLTGQVALVTGASRGIGEACALRLAEAGADIIVNYLSSRTKAMEVADRIQQMGRRAVTVKADVAEPEDVSEMMRIIGEQIEALDILVSNAASGGFRPLMDSTSRHFDSAMHTNAHSLISLVQSAQPLLTKKTGQSKVVAISSHGSHRALSQYAMIGASKAALESIVRHWALELGPQGINFNVVLAGLVETDSTRALPGAQQLFEAVSKQLLVPGRQLMVSDVADAVLYLASPLSDLVQGATLTIDGGMEIHG